jgi:translocator protein
MSLLQITVGISLPLFGGMAMGFLTSSAVKSDWYKKELKQPSFQPPPFVFGPVWTLLYIAMGYASARVYN